MDESRFACIIVAGGSGQRFGGDKPKQFQDLNGYPVYIWSIYNAISSGYFSDLVVVAPATYIDEVQGDLDKYFAAGSDKNKGPGAKTKIGVIAGGDSRQASVFNGLQYLDGLGKDRPVNVVIHDAARPLAGAQYFQKCAETIEQFGACTIGLPVSDTIKSVANTIITKTVDRSSLWSVQTPQGAPFDLLLRCHKDAAAGGISVTDDAAILEAFAHPVRVFEGFTHNIKVTVADDFKTCQLLAPLYLSKSPMQP